MRVILVESDPIVVATVSRYLKKYNYDVFAVAGAQEAIHKIDTISPDVVVLDIALRGHSGIEFLHEFRSYHDWNHVPILVWTMQQMTQVQTSSLKQLGVSAVLYKPHTTLLQLQQKLDSLVKTHA